LVGYSKNRAFSNDYLLLQRQARGSIVRRSLTTHLASKNDLLQRETKCLQSQENVLSCVTLWPFHAVNNMAPVGSVSRTYESYGSTNISDSPVGSITSASNEYVLVRAIVFRELPYSIANVPPHLS
jgi:hypothetical protein